jgi:hypothetical protein
MFIAEESASEFLRSYNYEKVLSLSILPGDCLWLLAILQVFFSGSCKLPPSAGFRISLLFIRSESLDQYQSGTGAHVACKMS